jgi:hypothetical protein
MQSKRLNGMEHCVEHGLPFDELAGVILFILADMILFRRKIEMMS